jgi:hypothetical protein
MATPVLGPETKAENKNNNVNLTRIEKERLERLKRLNPEVPKERTLMEKLVDQLRKSLTGKNLPTDVALAERRLQAGKYGEIEEGNPAPFKKPETAKPKPKPKSKVIVSSPMPLTAAQLEAEAAEKRERDLNALIKKEDAANYRERGKNADNSKFRNVKVPVKPNPKPKTIETPNIDKLQSVPEAKKNNSITTAKKKRDRLFGLDFLPEIDSKEGGDKINLPFGLGSYETLPIEDNLVSSRNKKGGRINRKSGGKIRKAGCKRGMGKAMRGY